MDLQPISVYSLIIPKESTKCNRGPLEAHQIVQFKIREGSHIGPGQHRQTYRSNWRSFGHYRYFCVWLVPHPLIPTILSINILLSHLYYFISIVRFYDWGCCCLWIICYNYNLNSNENSFHKLLYNKISCI